MSRSIEFEHWLRFTLPKHLYLSESKQAAMNSVFYHFADFIRPLEQKTPRELDLFFSEIKKLVKRAGNKRCPRDYFVWEGRYCKKPKINQKKQRDK